MTVTLKSIIDQLIYSYNVQGVPKVLVQFYTLLTLDVLILQILKENLGLNVYL